MVIMDRELSSQWPTDLESDANIYNLKKLLSEFSHPHLGGLDKTEDEDELDKVEPLRTLNHAVAVLIEHTGELKALLGRGWRASPRCGEPPQHLDEWCDQLCWLQLT